MKKERTVVIEAEHYREEVVALRQEPIIVAMTKELVDSGLKVKDVVHGGDETNPIFSFMMASGTEYKKRGGKLQESIGGPARAIIALMKESK